MGFTGIASNGGDGDSNSNGTNIVFCLFFNAFTFFFSFFLGGYKITEVGVDWACFYLEGFRV